MKSFAIAPLLVIAVILIAFIVGITLWIIGGRSRSKGEMSCGGCDYPVRGLEALHCPECGADLRMVGINRTSSGSSRGFGIGLIMVTAFIVISCLGSWLFLSQPSSPSPGTPTRSLQSTPSHPYPPPQPATLDAIESSGEDQPSNTEEPTP